MKRTRPAPAGERGHHLNELRVSPSAEPRPIQAAPLPTSSASTSRSGGVIQRSRWKKALAGLAAVGGGVAAGLGGAALLGAGLAMAPALAIGLAVGGGAAFLGGAGYLAYKAYQRRRQQRAGEHQRLIEEPEAPPLLGVRELHDQLHRDREELRGARPGSRQELLHNILDEGLSQVGQHVELSGDLAEEGGGDTQRVRGQRGQYIVRMGRDQPDPLVRPGFLLHELIHASADRSYRVNAEPNREFLNVLPPEGGEDLDTHVGREGARIGGRGGIADQLLQASDRDGTLTREQRSHIERRAGYIAAGRGAHELDTVATDLLYYAHKHGIPEDSPAHQFIQGMARDAYEQRRRERALQ